MLYVLREYLLEHNRYCNVIGIVVIISIALFFSKNRSCINFRALMRIFLLHMMVAGVVLKTACGKQLVSFFVTVIGVLYQSAEQGGYFVFGNLFDLQGPWGFIFFIRVVPIIVFFGAFTSLLFYWNVIQRMVNAVSCILQPVLGTTGPETLCAIANSFLGQTEAPLLIKHYIRHMTRSEIFVVMVSGMATLSGAILVVYASFGVPVEHLLASSIMSITASIFMAKLFYPEVEASSKGVKGSSSFTMVAHNSFDALAIGTKDGLSLAVNVAAMLITFLSLLALINYGLGLASEGVNIVLAWSKSIYRIPVVSLELVASYVLSPFGYLLGFTGDAALAAGQLLGKKIVINELVAYNAMVKMSMPNRFTILMTYALCGFSNLSCIGIQIGGIGALVPEKRKWLTELGLHAVAASALANLFSALVVGLFI